MCRRSTSSKLGRAQDERERHGASKERNNRTIAGAIAAYWRQYEPSGGEAGRQ